VAGLQIAVAALVCGVIVDHLFRTKHRPSRQHLLGREADQDRWVRLYQGEDLPVVQEALAAVASAFLLRADDVARLLPEDRLMDIYRAAYPDRDTPDALEFEMLWKDMKEALQASDGELGGLTQMTVREVVEMWRQKRRRRLTTA